MKLLKKIINFMERINKNWIINNNDEISSYPDEQKLGKSCLKIKYISDY